MRSYRRTIAVLGASLAGFVGLRAAAIIPDPGLANVVCGDPAMLEAQLTNMPDLNALLFGMPAEDAVACDQGSEAPGCAPAGMPRLLHGSTAGAERFRAPAPTAPNR